MQILASALPGFRELRAPLVAGYLWLVLLWILNRPDIHNRPANAVAATVYDLAKDVGPIWTALGASVAAYLIGSVSQALSSVLSQVVSAVLPMFPVEAWRFDDLGEVARKYVGPRTGGRVERLGSTLDLQFECARKGLQRELALPTQALLMSKTAAPDIQLFGEVDRLRAERELRLAVVPPLLAVVLFIGWNQSHWWWLMTIPLAVLLVQAHERDVAFRAVVTEGMLHEVVPSPTLSDLRATVSNAPLPDEEAADTTPGPEPQAEEGVR